MPDFKWNGGGVFKGKPWGENLPSDSEVYIILWLILGYIFGTISSPPCPCLPFTSYIKSGSWSTLFQRNEWSFKYFVTFSYFIVEPISSGQKCVTYYKDMECDTIWTGRCWRELLEVMRS